MIDNGYTFDFVSDRQLLDTRFEDNAIQTDSSGKYRGILVPAAQYITIETAERLLALAESGATVLVWKDLPRDVPGWLDQPGSGFINARAESVADKPSFRDAFARRRCLVPADGFYEWRRDGDDKIPHWFHPSAGAPVAFGCTRWSVRRAGRSRPGHDSSPYDTR